MIKFRFVDFEDNDKTYEFDLNFTDGNDWDEWFEENEDDWYDYTDKMETRYHGVHDFGDSNYDGYYGIGFCTYEIPKEDFPALMEDWKEFFKGKDKLL